MNNDIIDEDNDKYNDKYNKYIWDTNEIIQYKYYESAYDKDFANYLKYKLKRLETKITNDTAGKFIHRFYSEYGLNMCSRKISKKGTYTNPEIDTYKYINYVRNNIMRSSPYIKNYMLDIAYICNIFEYYKRIPSYWGHVIEDKYRINICVEVICKLRTDYINYLKANNLTEFVPP